VRAQVEVAVLDAAARLFAAQGSGVTTMKDIAAEAGVSVESVYAQGSKSALLLACVDRSIVGDDEPVPLLERDDMRALLAGTDPRERLAILRAVTVERLPGFAPIIEAFRGAAAIDPKLAAEWKVYEDRRYADCVRLMEGFAAHLRPGLTVSAATDVLWAMAGPSVMRMFTHERGWSVEQFADWLVDGLARLLLDESFADSQNPFRKVH
jgi:AcrR family transcriptional regulator